MNHYCNGKHFEAAGRRWYRCFGDGSIVPAPTNLDECPSCGRRVESTNDYGTVPTRSRVQVKLPAWGRWFDLPVEQEVVAYGEVTPQRSQGESREPQPPASSEAGASAVASVFDGLDLSGRVGEIVEEYISRRKKTDEGIAVHDMAIALARTEAEYDALAKRVLSLVTCETPLSFWRDVGAAIGLRATDPVDLAATFNAAHAAIAAQAQPLDSLRDRDPGDETDVAPWVFVPCPFYQIPGVDRDGDPIEYVCELALGHAGPHAAPSVGASCAAEAGDEDAHRAEVHPGHVAERAGVDVGEDPLHDLTGQGRC